MGTNHTTMEPTMEIVKRAEIEEIRQEKITKNQFPLVLRRIDEFKGELSGLTKIGAQFTIQHTELVMKTVVEIINKIAVDLFDKDAFPRIIFREKSKAIISITDTEKSFIFNQEKMFSKEIKLLFPNHRLVIDDLDGIINEGPSSKNEIIEIDTLGQGTPAVFFKQFLNSEAKINFTLLSQDLILKYLKINISKLNKKNTYVFFCKRNSFKKSSLDNILVFIVNKKDFLVTSLKSKKILKDITMIF
jgi:hypothetical protein